MTNDQIRWITEAQFDFLWRCGHKKNWIYRLQANYLAQERKGNAHKNEYARKLKRMLAPHIYTQIYYDRALLTQNSLYRSFLVEANKIKSEQMQDFD